MTDILKSCAIKRIEEKDNGSNGIYLCMFYLPERITEERRNDVLSGGSRPPCFFT